MAEPACPRCGSALAAGVLECAGCRALVHADALKELAARAEAATRTGGTEAAREAWEEALTLLPPSSRQHAAIQERIATLVPPQAQPWRRPAWASGAGLGALALLLWKGKAILLLALTKGKLVLLGLAKGKTAFSMLASLGVYWTVWGWKFALGFVLSIYLHEMGHVFALRKLGIPASAPMFIPGVGAFVRLNGYPKSASDDAEVGLAGPVWGVGAALAAGAVGWAGGWPVWLAIAQVGGFITLFNLIPVWQLDGARGFRALTRMQRALLGAVMLGTWWASGAGILLLVLAAALFRTFWEAGAEERDDRAFATFAVLLAISGALSAITVPGLPV